MMIDNDKLWSIHAARRRPPLPWGEIFVIFLTVWLILTILKA